MKDLDTTYFRKALLAARDDVLAEDEAVKDDRRPVELDQQSVGRLSRMDALQQQAMAQAQTRRRQAQIMRIDSALARLDEGEFGYCTDCGEEVGVNRLTLDPAIALCLSCAKG